MHALELSSRWKSRDIIAPMHEPTIPPDDSALRHLPSVDALLRQPVIARLADEFPRSELLAAVRTVLEARRVQIRSGHHPDADFRSLGLEVRAALIRRQRSNLRPVVNATGVVLHTGLGRAPLSREAADAVAEIASGYSNLEYDFDAGARGDRHAHVSDLLRELTGAEDALVVNNNAAATFLALHSLCAGRGVVVSRGELVEIGGSYRMPEIMAAAGCRMIEVGTTNRTRIADYERAVDATTAALIRVHTSNYRIVGFVEQTPLAELVALSRRLGLLVLDDLGSGLLFRLRTSEADRAAAGHSDAGGPAARGFESEPTVAESVAAGVDLTLFSGDKLLGGPQAGILVGRREAIARLRGNPMMRALRPDKLTLAAMEHTLRAYRDPQTAAERIPVLRMLLRDLRSLERDADLLAEEIRTAAPSADVQVCADESEAGGGSLPAVMLPTVVVSVSSPAIAAHHLAAALRERDRPVLCRVRAGRVLLDPRTMLEGDADYVAAAVRDVMQELL